MWARIFSLDKPIPMACRKTPWITESITFFDAPLRLASENLEGVPLVLHHICKFLVHIASSFLSIVVPDDLAHLD